MDTTTKGFDVSDKAESLPFITLGEASYNLEHVLFIRYYPHDDGLMIGCGNLDAPVLGRNKASLLRSLIEDYTADQSNAAESEMEIGMGYTVRFLYRALTPDRIMVMSLHEDPEKGRMIVMLDSALVVQAMVPTLPN